jgi:hypothetical protein
MAFSTLRRPSRLRRVNPDRRERLRAQQFGPHGERVKALRCCVSGALPPSDPAHVSSRGAGGAWRDLVPLSRILHREQHDRGILTFQRDHGIDLAAVAAMLAAVADRPRTACSSDELARRLRAIPPELRYPMLHSGPVKVPKTVALGTTWELAEWLVRWDCAYEIGRVLDLHEAIETWRRDRSA